MDRQAGRILDKEICKEKIRIYKHCSTLLKRVQNECRNKLLKWLSKCFLLNINDVDEECINFIPTSNVSEQKLSL